MDIFSSLSDDQIALMGCAVALVVSGSLMYVSYFIGNAKRPNNLDIRNHSEIDRGVVETTRRNSSKRAA